VHRRRVVLSPQVISLADYPTLDEPDRAMTERRY
jgi:hypothetical protein